jgi:ectoine hydroxylase
MSALAGRVQLANGEDLYPSRVNGPARSLPRHDPVVHGARPEQLSERQWLHYRDQGYLFIPDFLSPPEVRLLAEALDATRDQLALQGAPEVYREAGAPEVRSVFAVHRLCPAVAALARSQQLLAIAEGVVGGPVYIHQARVNYKPGFEGREFFWHSDFETWHVEDGMPRMRALSFSINLTENNAHNGPVMVVPGSHRHYLACPGRTPADHHAQSLVRQEYGVPTHEQLRTLIAAHGIEAPTGGPGSLLMFDCNMMHGSAGNITPYPRSNVFLVMNSVHNRLQDPYCGLRPRPEHVATRAHVDVLAPRPPGQP